MQQVLYSLLFLVSAIYHLVMKNLTPRTHTHSQKMS